MSSEKAKPSHLGLRKRMQPASKAPVLKLRRRGKLVDVHPIAVRKKLTAATHSPVLKAKLPKKREDLIKIRKKMATPTVAPAMKRKK